MTNIVLTGFMGTGKSVIGRAVASRLGRKFVDMDEEIEARAGKPIPEIFAQDGEVAFREMEAALCLELSGEELHPEPVEGLPTDPDEGLRPDPAEGVVIATGGGALVDPANRALMMQNGTVICLSCNTDEILRRLEESANSDRPLLDVADPRAEVERLLEARRRAYEAIPWQIDTTGISVEEVVAQVERLADVVTLPVRYPGGQYDIHLGSGLLSHVGGAMRAAGILRGTRVALISNPYVAPLFGAEVESSLREAGFEPFRCSVPDGEAYKTLGTVSELYSQFLERKLDRSGSVLALGGGVTGDVAGFAAATFMRGVNFVQVPTTLLAMVDASVGGKTGVDLPQGKNLVGAFKQPVLVLIDPSVLATLPEAEIRCGLAEVIKHGIISDPGLFVELEANAGALSSWQGQEAVTRIASALRVKIQIVEGDPYEDGRRAVLNLGHTVGHALEKLGGYSLSHGQSVSIGMVAAARIAVESGMAKPALARRIESVLSAWGLPVEVPPFEADAIYAAMAHDKKTRGRQLRWVLPISIGEVEIVSDVPAEIVKSVLKSLGARS